VYQVGINKGMIKLKLATTSEKYEKQKNAKNNVELSTKVSKTTWKTLKRVLDEAETGLSRRNL
jgi:hypothetical protein